MINVMKTKLVMAAAVLLMGGTALAGASRPVAAQTATPEPATPTVQCSAQDAIDGTEPVETTDPVDPNGALDTQCGDQNDPDAVAETVETADSGADADQTQQQDGPQDQNDGQPETPDANG